MGIPIGARKLILTHFSGRYDGDDEERTSCIMRRIESIAAKASGMKGKPHVAAFPQKNCYVVFR